jgi:hypothetical protein
MGEPAEIINRAQRFADGIRLFDSEPANDTTPGQAPTRQPTPEYKWIHCSNEGTYRGHHQGEFTFTRETFEAFVRNFRASPQYKPGALDLGGKQHTGGVRQVIQFDYEHASEMPPWEGNIPNSGAPAPAWALEVEIRDGADGKAQLWAFGKLGSVIRKQIDNDEYLFVSIAFTLEGVHWVTGKPIGPLLTSIAFTNHPFMADLTPLSIAASARATSQPGPGAVPSASEPPVAPGGPKDNSRPGATTMEVKTRDRICRALRIQTLADDEAVVAAVEETASSGSKLKSLVDALGTVDYDGAMKVVPELKEARDNAAALLAELNGLLGAAQAADAQIAPVDVSAAMRASNYKGAGAEVALKAHRQQCIDTEIEKLERAKAEKALPNQKPERIKAHELSQAMQKGREAFLAAHGVKNLDNAHLGTAFVAGPNGQQLTPPSNGGSPMTVTQTNGGGETIDLRAIDAPNPLLKMVGFLKNNDPGFARQPLHRQLEAAQAKLSTVQVIQ